MESTYIPNANLTEVNTGQIRLQGNHNPNIIGGGFDSVMDKVGMGLSVAGPVASAGLGSFGLVKAGAVTNAALSGLTAGPNGTPVMSQSYGQQPYVSWSGASKGYTMSAPPGSPWANGGSTGTGGAGGMGGTGSTGDYDSMINNMMSTNMAYVAMQAKIQNNMQIVQATSNILSADNAAKTGTVRNLKG